VGRGAQEPAGHQVPGHRRRRALAVRRHELVAAYGKQKGLGGVMVWKLDGDDGTLTTAVDTGLR
jgi:hypothetical protein